MLASALAAAADPSVPWGPIVAAALLWVAKYLLTCWWRPYAACRHCEKGRVYGPSRKTWRRCGWCGATGTRLRAGRKLWTYAADTHRASRGGGPR